MATTKAHECGFIEWTPKSTKVETISFDEILWQEKVFLKLSVFHHEYVLPSILY